MFVIAAGQSTSAADALPVSVFAHQVQGFLRDLSEVSFEVYAIRTEAEQAAPVKVLPVGPGRIVLDPLTGGPDRLGPGRYAARFTADAGWSGRYMLRWYWRSAPGAVEQRADEVFDVVGGLAAPVSTSPLYALPSDLRAEGVPVTVPDVRLLRALDLASRQFERFTRRTFAAQYRELLLDGNGSASVLLRTPIAALEALYFASLTLFLSELPADATGYRVYNRHLRGLLNPDDRNAPRVELFGIEDYVAVWRLAGAKFPTGKQNVRILGVFGYTDPGGLPCGVTPGLVTHAVTLLAYRHMQRLSDASRASVLGAPFVSSEETREQKVSFSRFGGGQTGGLSSSVGAFTGDPEIDTIVAQFRAPLAMESVLGCRATAVVLSGP